MDLSLLVVLFHTTSLMKWSNGLFLQASPENLTPRPANEVENTRSQAQPLRDELDQKVLNMFGLSKRPRSNRKLRIPKLMQHLYKSHMGDYYEDQHDIMKEWETGFDLPPYHVTSTVNTARSFHHIGKFINSKN